VAVERHLFDAFIPAAYRSGPARRGRAQKAEEWLVFLARHLEHTIDSPDLAWWQLRQATGLAVYVTGSALEMPTPKRGVRFDLAEFCFFLAIGLILGLMGGLLAGFLSGLVATAFGIAGGFLAGIWFGFLFGIGTGLGAGLPMGVVRGLSGVSGGLEAAASPWAVLARDRQTALILGCGSALLAGIGGGAAVGIVFGLRPGVVAGAILGFIAGIVGGVRAQWPSYMSARAWLALRHRLPWRLATFLTDAHQRGVLRQAGAVYQFRHIELQHRLANQPDRQVTPWRAGMAKHRHGYGPATGASEEA
jgi:hypothetical protein